MRGGRFIAVAALLAACTSSPSPGGAPSSAARASTAPPSSGSVDAALQDNLGELSERPNPQTVEEFLDVPRGSPGDWTLYETGTEPGSVLFDIHADGKDLYWSQKAGRLMRGSTDGTATPEQIGRWGSLGGFSIDTDETRVFWLDDPLLRWRLRDLSEPEQELTLSGGGSAMTVTKDYVFVAGRGCATLLRLNTKTWKSELVGTKVVVDEGPASIWSDGTEVVCAAAGNVVRFAEWSGLPQQLVARKDTRIWSMTSMGDHIYWAERPSLENNSRVLFGRVLRTGGEPELFRLVDDRLSRDFVSKGLVPSPDGTQLFYSSGKLMSLVPETTSFRFFADVIPTGFFSLSDNFLYLNTATYVYRVSRMPVDYAPIFETAGERFYP